MNKVLCGDANPKGNIELTRKGGCRKELDIKDAYRCTGCGSWFHKKCIIEHFKLEEKCDWGRQEEKKKMHEAVEAVRIALTEMFERKLKRQGQAPIGVSQWKKTGEKYGYDKYFEEKLRKEIDKILSDLQIEYANTPLKERTHFEWISKAKKLIKEI